MFKSGKRKVISATVGGVLLALSITGAAFADTNTSTTPVSTPANPGVHQKAPASFDNHNNQNNKWNIKNVHPMHHFNYTEDSIMSNNQFLNDAATILGLNVGQLKLELMSGQSLAQIVTAQGLTMDQFCTLMDQFN